MARYLRQNGVLVPIGPGPFEPIEEELNAIYLRRDGTVAATDALNAGGFPVTNLAAPIALTDAATKAYVDDAIAAALL